MEQTNNIADFTEERRAEIITTANEKYTELMNNGGYKDLLISFGKNNVSLTNILYVLSQNPNATVVRNMTEWNKLGRNIVPGRRSMEIMAPTKEEETRDVMKNGEPVVENGQTVTKTFVKTAGFHPAYVFDISATEGEPFKPYALSEKISDRDKNAFLDGVYRALGTRRYKYKFVDANKLPEKANCMIDADSKTISVRKGMNNFDTVLTMLDATARALAGNSKSRLSFEGLFDENAANIEAASIDCILAAHYGLDTSAYDFSEMNEWDEKRKTAFRDNLNAVCYSTKLLTDKVDYSFYRTQQSAVGIDSVLAPRAAFQGFGKNREAVAE